MAEDPKYLVGLTGGIASGKSAAAAHFRELGVEVIDADQVSRDLVTPGSPALAAIAAHFGDWVLAPGGGLDRAALRGVVFGNPEAKVWLERLLHPLIREEIARRIENAASDYVVLEVPLLLESGEYAFVDRVLVVDLPPELQLERAQARDNRPREEIENIIAAQMPRQERLRLADDVIDNSGPPERLVQEVNRLHEFYRKEAGKQNPSG